MNERQRNKYDVVFIMMHPEPAEGHTETFPAIFKTCPARAFLRLINYGDRYGLDTRQRIYFSGCVGQKEGRGLLYFTPKCRAKFSALVTRTNTDANRKADPSYFSYLRMIPPTR